MLAKKVRLTPHQTQGVPTLRFEEVLLSFADVAP